MHRDDDLKALIKKKPLSECVFIVCTKKYLRARLTHDLNSWT